MADLYHYGVKGQKWGVRRKLKGSGDRVATSLRNTSNQISHPIKYAKAAKRETKGYGFWPKGYNHETKKRLVADVNKQISDKRTVSRKRVKSFLKKSGVVLDKVSKVASGMESDSAMMKLHRKYPDLYENPLSKYK